MFWFDKNNPNVVFADIRTETHVLCDGRTLSIEPELEVDFTNMPFENESFYLISFDPPHMTSLGANSWMAKKYGRLSKENWRDVIGAGFTECMRVLKVNGTLVFKWNETDIKLSEVLELLKGLGYSPLFGHTTGRQAKTIWMTFFKQPNQPQQ